jgi:hypothetical protein
LWIREPWFADGGGSAASYGALAVMEFIGSRDRHDRVSVRKLFAKQ